MATGEKNKIKMLENRKEKGARKKEGEKPGILKYAPFWVGKKNIKKSE